MERNKRCQQCGLVNFAGTSQCRRCSAPIAWGAEGAAIQPEISPSAAAGSTGGDSYQYQQPFQAGPSNYGATPGGNVSPYSQSTKLRSGMAMSSLVLGIFGIFSAGLLLVGSLIGLILGIRAVRKARRDPQIYGGQGVAIGGIVTNSIGIISIFPLAIIAAIALPNLLLSRIAANEAFAIGHLRSLTTAESIYQSTLGGGRRFGTMEELIASGSIPKDSASKFGYKFKVRLLDSNDSPRFQGDSDVSRFEVVAIPESYGSSGRRSFYVIEDYVIRGADRRGKEATRNDPTIVDSFERQEPPFEPRRAPSGSATPRRSY